MSGIVIVFVPVSKFIAEPVRSFRGISDSPYYYSDGGLRAILEARLATGKLWEKFQPFS